MHCDRQPRMTPRTIWRYNYCSAINWQNRFMEIMSTCIAQQSLKHRRNVLWLTKNITRHIRMRNTAFHAARSAEPTQYSKSRKHKKKVTKMTQKPKSSYFKNLNFRNKNKFWKTIQIPEQTTVYHPNPPLS